VTTAVAGGLFLYQTHDIWLPWVNNLMGNGVNAPAQNSGSCADVIASLTTATYASLTVRGTRCTGSFSLFADFALYSQNGALTYRTPGGCSAGQYVCTFIATCDGNCATGNPLNHWNYDYGRAGETPTGGSVSAPWTPAQNTQTTSVDCINTQTQAVSTISNTEVGQPDRYVVPSCKTELGDGWLPKKVTVSVGPAGGAQQHVVETVTPNHQWGPSDTWRDCLDAVGNLKCRVQVYVGAVPCTNDMTACHNWQQYANDHPDVSVSCQFGSHALPISDCAQLKWAYALDPASSTRDVTKTGTDGSVQPATGASSAPDTSGSSQPTTGANPDTAGGPATAADANTSSCWGTGWSWNPVSWVVIPIKCSLAWAFVPTTAPSWSDVQSPLPAGWLPALPSLGAASCGAVTMPHLTLGYKSWGVGPTQLFNTCTDPWPLVRTFTYNGLLALLLVTVAWQGFRAVTSGVGMGVNIGGGGDDE
jgi:hypothetical protein